MTEQKGISMHAITGRISRAFLYFCVSSIVVMSLLGGHQVSQSEVPLSDLGLFHAPTPPNAGGIERAADGESDGPIDPDNISSRNEVSVAVHPKKPNVIVAAMHDFAENADGPAVVAYRSTDGGDSYKRTGIFRPPVSSAWTADPAVAFDSRGRAYVSYLQSAVRDSDGSYGGGGVFVARSDDGGGSWAEPRQAVKSFEQGVCAGQDKTFMGVGPAPSGKGDIVYLSWQEYQTPEPDTCDDLSAGVVIKVAHSSDGGRSFSRPKALSTRKEYTFGSMPRVAPDGTVYVSFLLAQGSGCEASPNTTLSVVLAKSKDGGKSFSRSTVEEICAADAIANGAILGANSVPVIDVADDGTLAAVWTAGEGDGDTKLEIVVSSNEGHNWRRLPDLAVGPETASLQEWLAFGPDGRLHVMYLAAAPGGLFDAYLASFEGKTWSDPQRLSSFSSTGLGAYPGFGLGHYPGFDVGKDGVGHAMWPDARGLPAMYTLDIWTRSLSL